MTACPIESSMGRSQTFAASSALRCIAVARATSFPLGQCGIVGFLLKSAPFYHAEASESVALQSCARSCHNSSDRARVMVVAQTVGGQQEAQGMNSERPLAAQLRDLWARVDTNEITSDAAMAEQERLLDTYRQVWTRALLLKGETDLTHSTLKELATRRGTNDLAAVRRRCEDAVQSLKLAWDEDVETVDTTHVERFYDRTELFI